MSSLRHSRRISRRFGRHSIGHLREAIVHRGLAVLPDPLEDRPVARHLLAVTIGTRMIQVENYRAIPDLLHPVPDVDEPLPEAPILVAVAHPVVEAVDRDEPVLPRRDV